MATQKRGKRKPTKSQKSRLKKNETLRHKKWVKEVTHLREAESKKPPTTVTQRITKPDRPRNITVVPKKTKEDDELITIWGVDQHGSPVSTTTYVSKETAKSTKDANYRKNPMEVLVSLIELTNSTASSTWNPNAKPGEFTGIVDVLLTKDLGCTIWWTEGAPFRVTTDLAEHSFTTVGETLAHVLGLLVGIKPQPRQYRDSPENYEKAIMHIDGLLDEWSTGFAAVPPQHHESAAVAVAVEKMHDHHLKLISEQQVALRTLKGRFQNLLSKPLASPDYELGVQDCIDKLVRPPTTTPVDSVFGASKVEGYVSKGYLAKPEDIISPITHFLAELQKVLRIDHCAQATRQSLVLDVVVKYQDVLRGTTEGEQPFSKEWCMQAAEAEAGHDVTAGVPDHPATHTEVPTCPTCRKVLEDCGCDGLQGASDAERRPFSKEWSMKVAEAEAGHDVAAGVLSAPIEVGSWVVVKKSRLYEGGVGSDGKAHSEESARRLAAEMSKKNPVGYEAVPFRKFVSPMDKALAKISGENVEARQKVLNDLCVQRRQHRFRSGGEERFHSPDTNTCLDCRVEFNQEKLDAWKAALPKVTT